MYYNKFMKILKNNTSIEKRISLSNLILVFLTIFISASICLFIALLIAQNNYDKLISNVAKTVSNLDVVKTSIINKKNALENKEFMYTLDNILNSIENIDLIVVCDKDGNRYFHNDKEKIGQHFIGDDYGDIINGLKPYITENTGTLGRQRRAFYPITDKNGKIIGFTMSAILKSHITKIRINIITIFIGLFILFSVIGIIFSKITMRYIRKLLLGYNPEEFKNLYLERNEVVDVIEDGIVAINEYKKIILINKSAKNILSVGDILGDEINSEMTHLIDVKSPNLISINGNKVLCQSIPIYNDDKIKGYTIILKDITQIEKLNKELIGTKTTVDMLRTFNHDFSNKLHIILGYLESNSIELAKDYIMKTNLLPSTTVNNIVNLIPIPSLSALIIGKIMEAQALKISINLKSDSFFVDKEKGLSEDEYVTIIGNLLDNSIDELNSNENEIKNIELGIYSDYNDTIITCDDTGNGIEEKILYRIYEMNTTTKGKLHGIGLYKIRKIVDNYGGIIHIDTEKDMGTSIEIDLPL